MMQGQALTLRWAALASIAALLATASAQAAEKHYGPGVSDTEITLGQTMPYSGPGSPYGVFGRVEAAYFDLVNSQGGVNGRKIKFISLDDSYSPPKTVEQTRKLIEQDNVLGTFNSLGTATQAAVQRYLNQKKVPQLLINAGASRWNDPKQFPWTTPGLPLYTTESHILAKYVLSQKPNGKIGILAQNDDLGRDYTKAFKETLGDKAKTMIVKEETYELTDPTVDSQLLALRGAGADVLFSITTGKATSQELRKIYDIGWHPLHVMMSASTSSSLLKAAGYETAVGLTTVNYFKHVGDAAWANDPEIVKYKQFLKDHTTGVDPTDDIAFLGYSMATVIVKILDNCGDNLTRENLLHQATSLKGMTAPALLPGITYAATPTDYALIKKFRLTVFNGKDWDLSKDFISDD